MRRPAASMLLRVTLANLLFGLQIALAANHPGIVHFATQLSKDSRVTDLRNAEIDLEYEAAKCNAYYTVNYALAIKSGYKNTLTGKKMERASLFASKLTFLLGKGIGMSQAAMDAQMKMDIHDIAKKLGKNYVNIPEVVENVGLPCKALLEHPTDRLAYWLKFERKQDARARQHHK